MKIEYLKLTLLLLGFLACLGGSGFVGWKVDSWYMGSKGNSRVTDALTKQADALGKAMTRYDALEKQIAALDRQNQHNQQDLSTRLEGQSRDFNRLRSQILTLPLGMCSLSPDADGVLDTAYQAAFGAPELQSPAAQPAQQAAGGHGAAHSTGRPKARAPAAPQAAGSGAHQGAERGVELRGQMLQGQEQPAAVDRGGRLK